MQRSIFQPPELNLSVTCSLVYWYRPDLDSCQCQLHFSHYKRCLSDIVPGELAFNERCPEMNLWDDWPILEGIWSVAFTQYGQIRRKRRVTEEAIIVTEFVSRHQNLRETRFTGVAHWVSHKMILTVPEESDRFSCGRWNGQGVVSKYF